MIFRDRHNSFIKSLKKTADYITMNIIKKTTIAAILCIAGAGSAFTQDNQNSGSIIEVEDEMIVKEIQIDDQNKSDSGSIIYDNEFDKDLKEVKKKKPHRYEIKKAETWQVLLFSYYIPLSWRSR